MIRAIAIVLASSCKAGLFNILRPPSNSVEPPTEVSPAIIGYAICAGSARNSTVGCVLTKPGPNISHAGAKRPRHPCGEQQ